LTDAYFTSLKDSQMIITLKKLITAVALMVLAPLAVAAGGDGIYVVLDAGRSTLKNSCNAIGTYTGCKDYDFGNRFSFGKIVADFTFAEIGYYSSGASVKKGAGGVSEVIDSVEWQFSGIRTYPIGDGRLSALGRVGIVHWEASQANASGRVNASGNDVLLGIGAKYFLTRDNTVRVFYESHKVGNSSMVWRGDVRFFSIGFLREL
jgi:hypothetical protein